MLISFTTVVISLRICTSNHHLYTLNTYQFHYNFLKKLKNNTSTNIWTGCYGEWGDKLTMTKSPIFIMLISYSIARIFC